MSNQAPGIDILNCGHGHMEVRFNEKDPLELERAKRIIGDMLRRGYVLFVEGADKALIRVERFDAEKGVYIIADGPLYAGEDEGVWPDEPAPAATAEKRKPGRPKKGTREVAGGRR